MSRKIDKIQITDPPLRELRKKKSCLTRSCLTGCGCVLIFIIVFFITLRFATTPKSKSLKKVPDIVKNNIPIYDSDSIESVMITYGQDRGRAIERAVFLPKILLSPLLVTLEKHAKQNSTEGETSYVNWEALKNVISKPVADHRDIVRIEWKDILAKPSFVSDYYQTELEKRGYKITVTADKQAIKQFSFKKGEIDGFLAIEDNPEIIGTDVTIITINVPSEK